MLNISFDLDETTHKITNLKVIDKEVVTKPEEILTGADLQVMDTKLQFTSDSIKKLKAEVGDRIAINYWYVGPYDVYPIISKAELFDGVDGNKLKKSKTIPFRGEQRDTLLKFGTNFLFEQWVDKTGEVKDGVFKLIPVKEDDSNSEIATLAFEEALVENMSQKELEDDAEWLMSL